MKLKRLFFDPDPRSFVFQVWGGGRRLLNRPETSAIVKFNLRTSFQQSADLHQTIKQGIQGGFHV